MGLINKKVFIGLFFISVLGLLAVIESFDAKVSWQMVDDVSDQLDLSLRKQLESEKEDALRFAIILSQDQALIDALAEDDEDKGYAVLSTVMNSVKQYTHTLVRSQIITKDYLIFARSWDNIYAGMYLGNHRQDLSYFKTQREPRVSIEVGRRLGIKATVPIYKKNSLLGFVEVLQFFDGTTDFFQKFGIDLYVLMDYDFYDIAVLMQNNPTVGSHIVANRRYNTVNLKTLQRIDMKVLRHQRVILKDDKYIFYTPMHDGEGNNLGAYVFVMAKEDIEYFGEKEKELSFLVTFSRNNLYDIVKKGQNGNRIYRSGYDKELLYLKDTVAEEDKELFMEEAYEILELYSKEELISMMLKHREIRKIEGKIR